MAGDWIKMTHALPEKPEVLAITGRTGLTRFDVVGRLFTLWRWFDIHTTDGNAPGVTTVTLGESLFGSNCGPEFIAAVVAAGWLSEKDGGLSVVKFDEHISESAKTRAQTAKRVAKSKAKLKGGDDSGNAGGNGEGNGGSVTKNVPKEEKKNSSSSLRSEEESRKVDSKKKTLKTYLAECKEAGVKPVPEDHPVRAYCRDAGITDEMLQVAWLVFRRDYTEDAKKKSKVYIDWPGHFDNSVRKRWANLWFVGADGAVSWSSTGLQEKAVLEARAAAREATGGAHAV